jgi:hypothetical protein
MTFLDFLAIILAVFTGVMGSLLAFNKAEEARPIGIVCLSISAILFLALGYFNS